MTALVIVLILAAVAGVGGALVVAAGAAFVRLLLQWMGWRR